METVDAVADDDDYKDKKVVVRVVSQLEWVDFKHPFPSGSEVTEAE